MSDQPSTCGQGLARRAPLPEKLAELTRAMAEVLDHHRNSLPQNDENARKELVAYANLLAHYRQASSVLLAAAQSMYSYRDLPMAPHDIAVLSTRENHDLFATFIQAERDLAAVLRESIESDEKILALMAG